MRFLSLLLALIATVTLASAQDAPLVADPGHDQFEFCKQLYRQANAMQVEQERVRAYQQLAPRLEQYINRFPRHANAPAASYYLGECYYQSGYLDSARQVLHGVINRYKTGRYVALSANRLGYDAFVNKRYNQAAIYFEKVATMSDTAKERYRGRYQEASCYRYSGQTDQAIKSYSLIEAAQDAPVVYRENATLRLGYLYFSKKELQRALDKFASLVKPGIAANIRVDAALNAGLISQQMKKGDDAVSYFKMVMLSKEEKFKSRAQAAMMNSLYASKDYQAVFDTMKRGNYPGKPATEAIKFTLAGRSAYQLKRYDLAIKYFAEAERQIPLSKEAFEAGYYRLLCFFNIKGSNIPKQVDAFLEVYQPRFPRQPKIHKALLMKAETLFDENKFREAASAYNQITPELVGEDNLANLLFKRGWCLSESGDHNGAIRSFTDFLKLYPDDERSPSVIARRGKSYLSLGDRASALRDFDELIKRFPQNKLAALAWQNSARIKKEAQDYPEMIRRYESMLISFPKLGKATEANAQYWIGWGNYQIKDYEKAIPALEQASEMMPEEYGFNSQMLLIYCSYAQKDKARLQSAVNAVRKKDQGHQIQPQIYRWLGVQCFNGGELKDAERFLGLGSTPEDPRQTPKAFWKMLGHARVEIGKNEEALVALGHFLDVVEEPFWKAEALLDQAKAYLGVGKLDEAKTSAEDGLALRPKGDVNTALRLVLGDIAFSSQDYETAAKSYVVVVEVHEADKKVRADALYKLYQALNKSGKATEAKVYLNTLNKEFPDYLKK
ncbi:tetratricopeptide repeat protein [Verrucomicrobiaceae bacterium N1E253]|uniref:Tetratricopeptide repeat protein n=1 Tax=Oceaniferula marina TaxID=2748318 RepID=A0A851GG18_9BACT|nr:tetratricopeptide repeat protein [Oceaniferula marina]NWK56326.1 tetratricopeptide repeat protein [Oceaniferula marina]